MDPSLLYIFLSALFRLIQVKSSVHIDLLMTLKIMFNGAPSSPPPFFPPVFFPQMRNGHMMSVLCSLSVIGVGWEEGEGVGGGGGYDI